MLSGPHIGSLLACLYARVGIGPIWVLYGCAHNGLAVWDHRTWGLNRLIIWAHMGPVWACPFVLDHMGPIWILYGLAHMGNSYTSHTWAIWDCYLGHTWVHYWRVYMRLSALDPYGRAGPSHKGPILACYLGPTWVYYMGLAEWDPYGSYKGVPIWHSHKGPMWGPDRKPI